MKIPLLNDGNSRRVASDLPVARELYEVRETSLLSNSPLINGHGNGALNGEANGNSENGLINGASNGFTNGRRFTADSYTVRNGDALRRDYTRRLSEDGTANRVARVDHADIDEQNGNDRGCCDDCALLMIDKSVQCDINMADDGVDSAASDYRGGMQMDNFSPPAPRDAEVTVVNEREWSTAAAGLNETVPVTAKTAPLNDALLKRIQPAENASDEAIKAWKKELADKEVASTSTQQQQQKPPTDDGPRYKLNNDGSESPDPDRTLNNTSTWRVRDHRGSSGSTSSDDEIEKISYLEMGGGEGDKPDKPDGSGVRSTQPNSRPAKDARPEPEEEDGECVIRCLAYTLQCCECVIS